MLIQALIFSQSIFSSQAMKGGLSEPRTKVKTIAWTAIFLGKNVFCRTFMSDMFVCIKNQNKLSENLCFFFDEKSFLINMHRTIYWHLKNKIVEKVYSNMKLCIIGRPDLFKQKRTVCILI